MLIAHLGEGPTHLGEGPTHLGEGPTIHSFTFDYIHHPSYHSLLSLSLPPSPSPSLPLPLPPSLPPSLPPRTYVCWSTSTPSSSARRGWRSIVQWEHSCWHSFLGIPTIVLTSEVLDHTPASCCFHDHTPASCCFHDHTPSIMLLS